MTEQEASEIGALLRDLLIGFQQLGDNLCEEMCSEEQRAAWVADRQQMEDRVMFRLERLRKEFPNI